MSDATLSVFPVGGLDETNDDVFGPATAMRICENVVFPDAMSASKRPGLVLGPTSAYAKKLVAHGNEVLLIDGATASTVRGADLLPRGRVSPCVLSRQLFAPGTHVVSDTAVDFDFPIVPLGSIGVDAVTGLEVRAWNDGLAVVAQIYDLNAQAFITQPTSLNDAAGDLLGTPIEQPRVVIVGSNAFVFYWDKAANFVSYRAIDLTNVAAGWTVQAITGAAVTASSFFDACAITGGTSIAIVAYNGFSNIVGYIYPGTSTTLPSPSASGTLFTTAAFSWECLGISANTTDGIALAWSYSSRSGGTTTSFLDWAVFNTSLGAVQSPITIDSVSFVLSALTNGPKFWNTLAIIRNTGVGSGSTAQWLIASTRSYVASNNLYTPDFGASFRNMRSFHSYIVTTVNAGAYVSTTGPHVGYLTLSKPFMQSVAGANHAYVLLGFADGQHTSGGETTSGARPTLVLADVTLSTSAPAWTPPAPVGVAAPGSAGDIFPMTCEVAPLLGGAGFTCIGTEQEIVSRTSLSTLRCDFTHSALWQSVRLGDWTFIGAGLPMIYDGASLTEVGFVNPPPAPIVFGKSGVSPITSNPELQYLVIYAQQDAGGNIHRSAPSTVVSLDTTVGGTKAGATQVDLYLFTCATTYRQATPPTAGDVGPNPVRIEVYRNTLTTPSIYYLVQSVANDPSTPCIAIVDTVSDANIASRPQYLQGGNPSLGPPNLTALAVHANRVVGIDEDGRTMLFTTTLTPGEAPRFTLGQTIPWPDGPITATWSLEQRLYAATATSTWFTIGEGPTDNNVGADWITPQRAREDMGVVDARGVALFEGGAVLSTKRGLYLQGRDGSWTWMPKARRTLEAMPVVTSIVPLDADGAVRISIASTQGPGTAGLVLHWDYRHDRWSTHVVSTGTGFSSAVRAGDAWTGLFVDVSSQVVTESATSFLDGGAQWVPMRLQWGWHSPAGLQGWAEVDAAMLLARRVTSHQIMVTYSRDFSTASDSPVAFTDAELDAYAAGAGGAEQMRISARVSTCEAVSVLVEDSAPAVGTVGTGEGAVMQSLLIRATPKRGQFHQIGLVK